MFDPSLLHVFTARSNPLGWKKPHENWEVFARHMLASGVSLTVIECAYGAEDFACKTPPMDDPSHAGRFLHVGVRAKTRAWNKECLLNIGIQRRPEAQYIGWFDADVRFRRPDWVDQTLRALQHYDFIQPWRTCYDLGPNDEHIAAHTSFAHQFFIGAPLVPDNWTSPYWQGAGGKNVYPHSGYAWCATRQAIDWCGGLFEMGAIGSADHHMALGLAGRAHDSLPPGPHTAYCQEVIRWGQRAARHVNGNIGYVEGSLEHSFHGRKGDRGYLSRWDMFIRHGFDPLEDLKRNSFGVLELSCNKPQLRRDFDRYLMSRNEDINSL